MSETDFAAFEGKNPGDRTIMHVLYGLHTLAPFTMLTLSVVALFAEGPTRMRNVAHIRHKETDRIGATACELRKLGATANEYDDGLEVIPGPLHGAAIDTYNDHRMAMSFALAGLRIPGVTIRDRACTSKTYPDYFEDLARLIAGA